MKRIKLLLATVLAVFLAVGLRAQQDEVLYGFIQEDPQNPRLLTAVIYPNFSSNNVTISTAVFTFTVPAGTVVTGQSNQVFPDAPTTGTPILFNPSQNGSWSAQKLTPGLYASVTGEPASDLENKDVSIRWCFRTPPFLLN